MVKQGGQPSSPRAYNVPKSGSRQSGGSVPPGVKSWMNRHNRASYAIGVLSSLTAAGILALGGIALNSSGDDVSSDISSGTVVEDPASPSKAESGGQNALAPATTDPPISSTATLATGPTSTAATSEASPELLPVGDQAEFTYDDFLGTVWAGSVSGLIETDQGRFNDEEGRCLLS